VSAIAGLAFGLALVRGLLPGPQSPGPNRSPFTGAAQTLVEVVSPHLKFVPTFRLGSGAQPFGWSTAVGDLNTDGTPDLVIADHTSHRAGVYAYQIQFSVSGLDARNFAFESPQDAVTVRISDVDHDDDLDVVVNSAASREVVGIWLNDGHGRFRLADALPFASEVQTLESLAIFPDRAVDPCTGPVRDRRSADGLAVFVQVAPAIPLRVFRPFDSAGRPSLRSSTVAPRGPPTSLA
jgi:hypothetical protein